MTPDPFASSVYSQLLTWTGSLGFIVTASGFLLFVFFNQTKGLPIIFKLWLLICFLLFSPARYIVLQCLLLTALPFQSYAAFFWKTPLLLSYIPIVFGTLYVIGLGIPFFLTLVFVGLRESVSRGRLFFAGIATPVLFCVFSTIFYTILPYAAYSTHWLGTQEVIRTTNGPSYYFYRYAVENFTPLQFPGFTKDIGLGSMSAKERFRAHVAALHCGKKQFSYYVAKAYPDYSEKIERENGGRFNQKTRSSGRLTRAPKGLDFLKAVGIWKDATRNTKANSAKWTTLAKSDPREMFAIFVAAGEKTLVPARQAVIEDLNTIFPELGTRFKRDFIPGIELAVQSMRERDGSTWQDSQVATHRWWTWYNENEDSVMKSFGEHGYDIVNEGDSYTIKIR